MARILSSTLQAALVSGKVFPALLVAMEWASGTTRFWGGQNDLSWNGDTYTAAGNLLTISGVSETVDLRANGLTVTLNGVNSDVLALALEERRQGKPLSVWIGFFDASDSLLDDPYLLFDGRVDVPTLRPGVEASAVTVSAESRLVDLQRARRSRYTPEDQKARYAGDRGLDFVPRIQGLRLQWGNQSINMGRPQLTPPAPAPPPDYAGP